MEIYKAADRKKFMPLLLIADEQESMIGEYIDKGEMYVLDDGGVKGEILVADAGGGVLEIKSLAVDPSCRRRGAGRMLIDFVKEEYRGRFRQLLVGTGDSPATIPFYEKCGFRRAFSVKDFYITRYDHPIVEDGVLLRDKVYLVQEL